MQTKTGHTSSDRDDSGNIEASQRLRIIYAINAMLRRVEADGLQLDIILPEVIEIAVKQLEADDGSIIVVNQELEIEHAWLADEGSSVYLDDIMNKGLAGWVIRNQQPIIIDDTQSDARWLARPGPIPSEKPWSIICTPLIIRNRAIGAITIHKAGANKFDAADLELLTTISSQAATTIENARLYEKSQRQLQISALLNEASRVINSSLDINQIMGSMLSQMNEFLQAQAISIALFDEQTNELEYRVAAGLGSSDIIGLRLPSSQGLSGWVVENGEPALVNDTSQDPRFHTLGDQRTGYQTQAMICAPVQFKGEMLGTIQAINPVQGSFTSEDLELLVNLASIASSALANAKQFARTQAAEARFTRLFQDSVDPIILTNLNYEIVEVNQQATRFMGYSRQELRRMKVYDLHPKETVWPEIEMIIPDEVTVLTNQALTKGGNLIHVEVYAKRTSFEANEFLQWIYHDISKQVELEKMREDLTAMLFHDLQSPLGNVITSLELLQYEIPADSDSSLRIMLDIAMRSSQRLQTLVRSLLDINQLEAGHPVSERTKVAIYNLIEEVHEIERPNFEKREVDFVRQLTSDLPYVFVDEDMIRRVLVNLVDNALKYGQDSDEITLEASTIPEENMVLISIQDQGEGIPVQYRQTVFDKFARIQRQGDSKGLGLGLAFCRLAVEAHGGRIWVDDAPNGGARFNFTLPAYVDSPAG